ncbi:hypothetical protein [Chromobacterium vaccinii]|uniref:hypothetical protein n=1 Tax=Chromobacterium vaccinii TaxID=1108595 RepID=UPI000E1382FC|nr:hypothetical protein [Chromobacterium vaccinii]SUX54295.1 Uncharacterised protein [Chromobacterium vaccinii]
MPFIPLDFTPPHRASFGDFKMDVLGPDYAKLDHQAVQTSANVIRNVFGPDNHWPPADINFEENLADLHRHFDEFKQRQAFAYCLLSPDEKRYLGCFYLKPIKSRQENDWRKQRFQAQAFLWLSADDNPLRKDKAIATLQSWLAQDWPLNAIAWPGREPSWEAWLSIASIQP